MTNEQEPTKEPMLLLAWLDAGEKQVADELFSSFQKIVRYRSQNTGGQAKLAIHDEILAWASEHNNAQFLFLDTHGDTNSVGPEHDTGATWEEFWGWLKESKLRSIELWLGACESVYSAAAFTSLLATETTPPVETIIGFEGSPTQQEILVLTTKMMEHIASLASYDIYKSLELSKMAIPTCKPIAYRLGVDASGKTAYIRVEAQPSNLPFGARADAR